MKTTFIFRFLVLSLMLAGAVAASHAQGVSAKELIIYYSFNEDTLKGDDVLDVSGNGNDGLLRGGNLDIVKGKVNECMEFPGSAADYISVRNHMYDAPIEEITFSVWVKTDVRGMIASWDRSEFFRFAVGDDVGGNNGTTFVAFDHCCPIHDWFGKADVADDKWHHLVGRFDGDEKRIYVDGKLDAKVASTTKVIGAGADRFGFIGIGSEAAAFNAGVGPNWAFNGLMDEFMLFHRALTEKEIERLAAGPANPLAIEPTDKLTTTWGYIKDTR